MHFSSPPHLSRHRPPHPLWFDRPNNIWCSSSLCSFLHPPLNQLLFGASSFLSALLSNTRILWLSLNAKGQFPHQYKTTGKITLTLHYSWILNSIVIFENWFYDISFRNRVQHKTLCKFSPSLVLFIETECQENIHPLMFFDTVSLHYKGTSHCTWNDDSFKKKWLFLHVMNMCSVLNKSRCCMLHSHVLNCTQ